MFVLLPGVCPPLMLSKSFSFFSWNVRGFGHSSRCEDVLTELLSVRPSFVSLQETKLPHLTNVKKRSFLPARLASCATVDATGASGGILTAWDSTLCTIVSTVEHPFTLTTRFVMAADNTRVTLTNVYAPTTSADRPSFFAELTDISNSTQGPWIVLGDFNLTRYANDKNQGAFNATEAARYSDIINSLALIEIPLVDRAFTWSNKRDTPTLVRLDRCFVNTFWDATFPNTSLSSLTRVASDHVPLLVTACSTVPRDKCFRFENSWLLRQDFMGRVLRVLTSSFPGPISRNFVKHLKSCRRACRLWAKTIRPVEQRARDTKILISALDLLEESRPLHPDEATLRCLAVDWTAEDQL